MMDRHLLWRGALLLLILLAFGLRVAGLTAQSFWRDETDALRFSTLPLDALLGNFTRGGWNGPLFYVFLRGWLAIAGKTEFAVRFFSLLWSVLGVALLYRVGREWCAPRIGALAALLMACSPYMIWYAQEAKMYALLCALVLVTLVLYRRVLGGGNWRLWLLVVSLIWIATGTHIMGALLVPLLAVLLWVWQPFAASRWREGALALGVSVLPGLVILPWVFRLLIRGGDIGHTFTPLPAMFSTIVYAFGLGIAPLHIPLAVGVFLFVLLAGTVLWAETDLLSWVQNAVLGRPRPRLAVGRCVLAAWAWILVPVVGLWAITLRVPMFVDRYLIWIGPAFYLLAARGLAQIWRRSAVVSGLCVAALVAFSLGTVWQQSAVPIKSDLRAAAAYVAQRRAPDELLLFHISYTRDAFEYYYGDAAPHADGLATDDDTRWEDLHAELSARVAGYEVIWLVLSEPEMWDARGMNAQWLQEHAAVEERAEFSRVSVIKYRLPPS